MKTHLFKRILFTISLITVVGLIFSACSKNDDDNNVTPDDQTDVSDTFTINGEDFKVNLSYLSSQTMPDLETNLGIIIITGESDSKIGTLNFPIAFAIGSDIQGTYSSYSDVATPGKYIGYMANYTTQDKSNNIKKANYPEGYIKVIHHQGKQYTVEFNMEFNDGVKAIGKIKRNFPTP